jgi:SAM-dependent methyltransferase
MNLLEQQNFVLKERDQFIIEFAQKLPVGSYVLDVGAGPCPYRKHFQHCRYVTQDFCQLDEGVQRGGAGYDEIDVISDIVAIPLDSGSVDAIICTEVLEHVPDPISAIKEMSRLLKPGGKIAITTPLLSFIHQEPHHYYGGFTPFFYEYFLNKFNFGNIKIAFNQRYFSYFVFDILRFLKYALKTPLFFILVSPFIILMLPLTIILFAFRKAIDKLDTTHRYTFALKVTAEKL